MPQTKCKCSEPNVNCFGPNINCSKKLIYFKENKFVQGNIDLSWGKVNCSGGKQTYLRRADGENRFVLDQSRIVLRQSKIILEALTRIYLLGSVIMRID